MPPFGLQKVETYLISQLAAHWAQGLTPGFPQTGTHPGFCFGLAAVFTDTYNVHNTVIKDRDYMENIYIPRV